MAWRNNNRSGLTNLGSVLVVIAVVLIIRNLFETFRSMDSMPGYSFVDIFFFAGYGGLGEWSFLINWVPIPLLIIGIPLMIAGRKKDRAKAEAQAQQLQQYGQAGGYGTPGPAGPGAAQSAPYGQAQAGQEAAPGQSAAPGQAQQASQGQPPYGQVPPLS